MSRLKKRIYDFDEIINDFMIYCTNKELTKKIMKSYESILKLFAKYLSDEMNIFTPLQVTTKHIKDYLEFTKAKGKYSYVADINSLKSNNPYARGDFGKQVSIYTVNNYLRNIKIYFTWLYDSKVIKNNPTVKIREYKHSRKPKSEIKDVDFNKILKCLDLTSFAEYRDYVILKILMDTGMRIGETLKFKQKNRVFNIQIFI